MVVWPQSLQRSTWPPGDGALDQMNLMGPHILDAEVLRRTAMVSADRGDVRGLRRRRQITDRHVLDHAPAQVGDTLTHEVLLSEGVGLCSTHTLADRTSPSRTGVDQRAPPASDCFTASSARMVRDFRETTTAPAEKHSESHPATPIVWIVCIPLRESIKARSLAPVRLSAIQPRSERSPFS